jgi:protein-S-isoprenylcysteine O-methyltransferase Ste14
MSEATKAIRPPGATPGPPAARARAALILGYAAAVYGLFLVALVYAVGFFAGFAVPKDIDDGIRSGWPLAVAIDVGLLALFAVQHTVMARSWFKRWLTRVVPGPAERATFVLGATLALTLLSWAWRPLGGVAWKLSGPASAVLLAVQFAAAATGYILAGIWFEQRDLVRSLGPAYASYLTSVPALIPGLRPRSRPAPARQS